MATFWPSTKPNFLQALAERRHEMLEAISTRAPEEPDHRQRWLLSACRERPRCCAAEKGDEIAAFQLIEFHSFASQARPEAEYRKAAMLVDRDRVPYISSA